MPETIKLHLGCGSVRKEGWVNVDSQARIKPDQVVDLTVTPWPWKDGSVDEIYASHLFEHLPNTVAVMDECHRVLKPGGTLEVLVPFALSHGYFSDPTHCRPWTDATVDYFVKGHNLNMYSATGFELVFKKLLSNGFGETSLSPKRFIRSLIPFRYQLRMVLIGMYDELHFKLRKPAA